MDFPGTTTPAAHQSPRACEQLIRCAIETTRPRFRIRTAGLPPECQPYFWKSWPAASAPTACARPMEAAAVALDFKETTSALAPAMLGFLYHTGTGPTNIACRGGTRTGSTGLACTVTCVLQAETADRPVAPETTGRASARHDLPPVDPRAADGALPLFCTVHPVGDQKIASSPSRPLPRQRAVSAASAQETFKGRLHRPAVGACLPTWASRCSPTRNTPSRTSTPRAACSRATSCSLLQFDSKLGAGEPERAAGRHRPGRQGARRS